MGSKLEVGINDLYTKRPDLAEEWHPSKNGELTPKDVCEYSSERVWWQIVEQRYGKEFVLEWEASVANRSSGSGCPYISNPPRKLLVGFNDMAHTNPELSAKWNYEKNGEITPEKIFENTDKKFWWFHKVARQGKEFLHEWKATPKAVKRTEGTDGCPICHGIQVQVGFNDLYSCMPELAKEWDYSKNHPLKPQEVTCGSNRYAYWNCEDCGHKWRAMIINRAHKNTRCPKCNQRKQTSFAEQAIYFYLKSVFDQCDSRDKDTLGMELDILVSDKKFAVEYNGMFWHASEDKKNNDKKKQELCIQNGITLICVNENDAENEYLPNEHIINCVPKDDNSHLEYVLECINKELLSLKVIDKAIPIALKRDEISIRQQYIQMKVQKSIATTHPKLIEEWDYEKNGSLKPSGFTKGSGVEVFWEHLIEKNGTMFYHSWKAKINKRTSGEGCPICAGKIVLEGFNDLYTCEPEVMTEWDYEKNKISPKEIAIGSHKRAWWIHKVQKESSEFIHSWEAEIKSRVSGNGCPICAGKKVLKGYNDLTTTHPRLLLEWDYEKNVINPETISYGYDKKVYWKHVVSHNDKECKHSWEASPNSRTNRNSGCPYCANKKVLFGYNDLKTLAPNIAEKWDYDKNYPLRPEEVTIKSKKRVYWIDRDRPICVCDRTKYLEK